MDKRILVNKQPYTESVKINLDKNIENKIKTSDNMELQNIINSVDNASSTQLKQFVKILAKKLLDIIKET